MKFKLLQSMAGIDFSHNVGDEIEVNDADAIQRYVERGIACCQYYVWRTINPNSDL